MEKKKAEGLLYLRTAPWRLILILQSISPKYHFLHKVGIHNIVVLEEFARVLDYLTFRQNQHTRNTNLLYEFGIVAYKQYRSSIVAEVFANDSLGIGIQVVGWLVEDKKVCAL